LRIVGHPYWMLAGVLAVYFDNQRAIIRCPMDAPTLKRLGERILAPQARAPSGNATPK
jgi:hypothetical protein